METLSISILNPRAKKLIKELAALNLIQINPKKKNILKFLDKIRSKSDNPPSLVEITQMVEEVRTEMFNAKK